MCAYAHMSQSMTRVEVRGQTAGDRWFFSSTIGFLEKSSSGCWAWAASFTCWACPLARELVFHCILDSICLHVFPVAARFPNIWWQSTTDSWDRTPQQSNCFDGVLVEMPLAFRKSHPHVLFGNVCVALGNSPSLGNCFKHRLLCAFSELSTLFGAPANSPLHCATSTCKPPLF